MALTDNELYLNKAGFDIFWQKIKSRVNSITDKVNAIALEDSEAIASSETDGFYFNLSDMKLYEKVGSQITESSKLMGFCVISKALFTENQEDLAKLDTFFFVYS